MKKRRFSISLSYNLEDWQTALELLHSDYFNAIEIPADFFKFKKLPSLLKQNKLDVVNVIDLLDPSILNNLATQNSNIRNELFELCSEIISTEYNFRICNYTLDLDFSLMDKESDQYFSKINFLKKISHLLYWKNKTICLPINFLAHDELNETKNFYLAILKEMISSGFHFSLNIYPHEIKDTLNPTDIYRWFLFDTSIIKIIYDPTTGNYITDKLLDHWVSPIDQFDFNGHIVLCPKTKSFTIFENEIRRLSNIIDKSQ